LFVCFVLLCFAILFTLILSGENFNFHWGIIYNEWQLRLFPDCGITKRPSSYSRSWPEFY
jgi:hypothetical protein